ncbi:MAG TPA: cytochrome P450 [Candidatus Binataceae bacterium]|nr:cytochrome P450 [Candidatus Binataceae bacterium]
MADDFYFNPYDENFRANPYPHYTALLSGPPRTMDFGMPLGLVARYADVRAVLTDHETFSSRPPEGPLFQQQNDLFGNAASMLSSDPPVHTRLRRLVARDFTPRRIGALEPRIREIAHSLLDRAQARGHFDVIADLATPLPVMVIAQLLGVPPENYEQFKDWSDRIIESDNVGPGMQMPQEIKDAFRSLSEYFGAEIDRRRREPGGDLISALVAAHDQSEALSADELLQFVILLLLAGNETTTNLIGNGSLALALNPAEAARLRKDPSLMKSAIEEMLRYDGPVQATFRTANRDVEVGGTKFERGTGVFVVLAAANRDPAQFPEPERFDIARQPNEHFAFGDGIHFCIGAPLARLEGAIAFTAMLERFGAPRLKSPDMQLSYKGSYALRGLSQLELAT